MLRPLPFDQPRPPRPALACPARQKLPRHRQVLRLARQLPRLESPKHLFRLHVDLRLPRPVVRRRRPSRSHRSLRGRLLISSLSSAPGHSSGRTFTPDDDNPSARGRFFSATTSGAIVSPPTPASSAATSPSTRERYTVVGVMPAKFRMPDFAWAWVPSAGPTPTAPSAAITTTSSSRGSSRKSQWTRPSPISPPSPRASNSNIPKTTKAGAPLLVPLREQMIGDVRTALFVLLGAVAFVLLIACANVANLVLAKTLARGKEMAIRSALGAGRAVSCVTSSSKLCCYPSSAERSGSPARSDRDRTLRQTCSPSISRHSWSVTLDAQVLAYTMLLSVAAGVLAGFFPSLRFSRVDVNEVAQAGHHAADPTPAARARNRSRRLRKSPFLSFYLIGAGLMIRTLWQLRERPAPASIPANVLTMSVAIPHGRFTSPSLSSKRIFSRKFCSE